MTDERRDDETQGGMTSGDPLRGPERPDAAAPPPAPGPERPEAPAPAPERPAGGSAPPPGYGGGPVPPGAFRRPEPATTGQYVLADWWRRAVALIVDGLVVAVLATIILVIFGAVGSVGFFGGDEVGVVTLIVSLLAAVVAVAIAALVYAPLYMDRTNGQTLGKQLAGIRVVRTNGQRTDFWWSVLREVVVKSLLVGLVASFTFGLASLVNYLWPLWDDENRAGHDFVAGSRVVRA